MALQEEWEAQGNVLFRYRGTLPLLILVSAIAVLYFRESNGMNQMSEKLSTLYPFVCLGVCTLGLIVRIITVGYTPVGTSGRNKEKQEAEVLNTSGIYSTVRHPLYLGNFFMWFGLAMLTQSLWFNVCFILFYWLYYERIMYAEEQFLRRKFGQTYLGWAEKTPPFIPKVAQWKSTDMKFSWRKILKKEKNGFAAMLIIIFVFLWISAYLRTGQIKPSMDFWFYSMAFGLVSYLILKFLKYNTKWLEEEGR
ncbi:MAG: isoprenylcysteine carboxylmethyltransferase family protein [Vicingaceae bacterium]